MAALRTTEPLRRELAATLPDRPFTVTFWDGTELPATNGGGPGASRALARRARPRAARARPARHRPRLRERARSRSTTSTRRWRRSSTTSRRRSTVPRSCGWPPPARARDGAGPAAAGARPPSCARAGAATASSATSARSRHHYDVSNDFFALWLDKSMTYSCAFFSRDGSSLEAAQQAKLDLVCTKLGAREGRADARRRLRLGLARDPRGARVRRLGHRDHAVRAAGRSSRASAPPRRASATASTSASWTTAS